MYKDSGSTNFSISVINMQGQRVPLDVHSETLIETIRDDSVKKLYGSSEFDYVLIHANGQSRRLQSRNTAKAENLTAGDMLLLYKTDTRGKKLDDEISSRSIPTLPSIKKATESLASRDKGTSSELSEPSASSTGNLEHTFRKILLTLLDLSYKLMFFDEEADGLFSKKKKRSGIDPGMVSSLVDMGFSESKSCKALKLNHMDVQAAMEWLLQHPDDDGNEEDMNVDAESENSENEDEEVSTDSSKHLQKRLNEWQRKTRQLKPNKDHVAFLVGMGFTKEDSLLALRLNGNNPNTACDWLLGDRKVPDDDPNDSLSPDSALYKAIISNPTIHIGLHNKRVLEALEDMLENPLRRHNWANDPTVGSVILQILKLYHKYSTSG